MLAVEWQLLVPGQLRSGLIRESWQRNNPAKQLTNRPTNQPMKKQMRHCAPWARGVGPRLNMFLTHAFCVPERGRSHFTSRKARRLVSAKCPARCLAAPRPANTPILRVRRLGPRAHMKYPRASFCLWLYLRSREPRRSRSQRPAGMAPLGILQPGLPDETDVGASAARTIKPGNETNEILATNLRKAALETRTS